MTESLISLDQLGEISPEKTPPFVLIEGLNNDTGYEYSFGFIAEHPDGSYIKIDTEPRRVFLEKGTEQEAQDALINLAQQVRRKSGGVISIHPFYGAVWGTKLTPVSPGFLTDSEQPDENLTMFVYLRDSGYKFDANLTKQALDIGAVVSIPGPKAADLLAYTKVAKANPNQSDRDIALVNKLGDRWDAEFKEYNNPGNIPQAMKSTPGNIVKLMRQLESETGMTDLTVTRVAS